MAEQGQRGSDNAAVDTAAMRVAMEYKHSHDRLPVDVSKTGVGYDARTEGADKEVRYIEVKGHPSTGDVIL